MGDRRQNSRLEEVLSVVRGVPFEQLNHERDLKGKIISTATADPYTLTFVKRVHFSDMIIRSESAKRNYLQLQVKKDGELYFEKTVPYLLCDKPVLYAGRHDRSFPKNYVPLPGELSPSELKFVTDPDVLLRQAAIHVYVKPVKSVVHSPRGNRAVYHYVFSKPK